MTLKKDLGKRIRELRVKRNLTQEFVAEEIDIKPANYSRIENGISYPKPENLEKICDVLGLKVKDLFDFEHLQDIEIIQNELIYLIQNDNEIARLLYKFLKTLKN